MSAFSAIIVKDSMLRNEVTPLAAVDTSPVESVESVESAWIDQPAADPLNAPVITAVADVVSDEPAAMDSAEPSPAASNIPANAVLDTSIRYFNGRPVRPVRTIRMKVTAYSPDEQSCGDSADGITSSLHHVWTNGGRLVAADSRVLPLGSIISVPGYDNGNVVPVLDRGGAIKGRRLDVLYPTHSQARKWGVQNLDVVVWEYADGKPACDFRAIRDSRN